MSPHGEVERLRHCISMAMGCISPLSRNVDERLAWYRLLDAIEGRQPRTTLETELRPAKPRNPLRDHVHRFWEQNAKS